MVMTVAHVLGGGPVWPLWMTGALLFGGAVAAMAVPLRLRRVCLAVAGVGLLSTCVVYALLPSAPSAPRGLSVQIAAPPTTTAITSPVLVKVCGSTSAIPGPGRLLSISVDGRQVAEVGADTAVVSMSAGTHTLGAELVTSQHRAYAPPLLTVVTVTVSGIGPIGTAPDCPASPRSVP
jgi:hypothetical protein